LAGRVLDAQALVRSLAVLAGESSSEIAARFDIDRQRARLLPAGLLILEAVAALLDAPLEVGRGGIREGVLLEAVQT
jgi:exopolyphosphatase/guanosine-5'-triphosphate,3'-diphosphate pyrophosphatase